MASSSWVGIAISFSKKLNEVSGDNVLEGRGLYGRREGILLHRYTKHLQNLNRLYRLNPDHNLALLLDAELAGLLKPHLAHEELQHAPLGPKGDLGVRELLGYALVDFGQAAKAEVVGELPGVGGVQEGVGAHDDSHDALVQPKVGGDVLKVPVGVPPEVRFFTKQPVKKLLHGAHLGQALVL